MGCVYVGEGQGKGSDIVNLREAIEAYANAVSNRDYYDDRGDAQRADAAAETLHQRRQNLDALLAVADAAIALSEYQAFAAFAPNVEAAVYFRERGRLWDAFMAAHKAAKDAN